MFKELTPATSASQASGKRLFRVSPRCTQQASFIPVPALSVPVLLHSPRPQKFLPWAPGSPRHRPSSAPHYSGNNWCGRSWGSLALTPSPWWVPFFPLSSAPPGSFYKLLSDLAVGVPTLSQSQISTCLLGTPDQQGREDLVPRLSASSATAVGRVGRIFPGYSGRS